MILTLIGARPQFVKAAVVSKAFMERGLVEEIIHSGQHYDERLSQIFWDELGIPHPKYNLNVGSGTHAAQTAAMMTGLEDIILKLNEAPRAILVYGDTNTTVAGSLVASKLHIPVIHIEAGLRSFNRKMPEEINRVVTDHLSDLLFCPSESAITQLANEGITQNVFNVGDVMYDSFLTFSTIAKKLNTELNGINIDAPFILLTLHRPSNTDRKDQLSKILNSLKQLPYNIIWPLHPRNREHIREINLPSNLTIIEPLSYFQMLLVLEKCNKVITDSGGLQKEAYWAQKPCITLREETEWIETLEGGWNQLASPANSDELLSMFSTLPAQPWKPLYGDGRASEKIAQIIADTYYSRLSKV